MEKPRIEVRFSSIRYCERTALSASKKSTSPANLLALQKRPKRCRTIVSGGVNCPGLVIRSCRKFNSIMVSLRPRNQASRRQRCVEPGDQLEGTTRPYGCTLSSIFEKYPLTTSPD